VGLADRIRYALANPLRDDHAIDPMRELADLQTGAIGVARPYSETLGQRINGTA
jgi:hypothetical protein